MVNVNFIGRLGADAEIRTSKTNRQYVLLRVATDEYRNGEKSTSWLNVTYFGDRALKIAQFLKKGSHVFVMGTEMVSTYKTRTEEIGISRDIIADRIEFVSSGTANTPHDQAFDTGTLQPTQPTNNVNTQPSNDEHASQPSIQAVPSYAVPSNAVSDEDDDLPF